MSAVLALVVAVIAAGNVAALCAEQDPIIEGFKLVEVASVADAMEQLYGTKAYMTRDMRPLAPGKFAGRAVTVLLKKEEEHREGPAASKGMLDAIDTAAPGSAWPRPRPLTTIASPAPTSPSRAQGASASGRHRRSRYGRGSGGAG
jgi:hypothetical protein